MAVPLRKSKLIQNLDMVALLRSENHLGLPAALAPGVDIPAFVRQEPQLSISLFSLGPIAATGLRAQVI